MICKKRLWFYQEDFKDKHGIKYHIECFRFLYSPIHYDYL